MKVRLSTHNPRIILASTNFSTELTTSVLWLNRVGLDITCVRLQLYSVDGSLFVEGNQILFISAGVLLREGNPVGAYAVTSMSPSTKLQLAYRIRPEGSETRDGSLALLIGVVLAITPKRCVITPAIDQ